MEHGGARAGVIEGSGNVVSSNPLFAFLFKGISAEYPELAALVLEITSVHDDARRASREISSGQQKGIG